MDFAKNMNARRSSAVSFGSRKETFLCSARFSFLNHDIDVGKSHDCYRSHGFAAGLRRDSDWQS
jgi:hypothetical protein